MIFKKIILTCLSLACLISLAACGDDNNTYTVKFDSSGGSLVDSQKIVEGAKVQEPTDPTRENYTFIDWYLNGVTYDFDTPVTKDITLLADWKSIESTVKSYPIYFDVDGGTSVSSQNIQENGLVSRPTDPTKFLNTFVEWQCNDVTYDFSSPVTSALTLKAVWSIVIPEYTAFTTSNLFKDKTTLFSLAEQSIWDTVLNTETTPSESISTSVGTLNTVDQTLTLDTGATQNKLKISSETNLDGAVMLQFDVTIDSAADSALHMKFYTNGGMSSSNQFTALKISSGVLQLCDETSSSGGAKYTSYNELEDNTTYTITLVFTTVNATGDMMFDLYCNLTTDSTLTKVASSRTTSGAFASNIVNSNGLTGINITTDAAHATSLVFSEFSIYNMTK